MPIEVVRFEVPGNPVGKGRPRFARRGGHVHTYTPKKTVSYESLVRIIAANAMGTNPLITGAADVHVVLSVQIPQSWSKKQKQEALNGDIRPTFDAMNGIVWVDDRQACDLTVRKRYASNPCALVVVNTK